MFCDEIHHLNIKTTNKFLPGPVMCDMNGIISSTIFFHYIHTVIFYNVFQFQATWSIWYHSFRNLLTLDNQRRLANITKFYCSIRKYIIMHHAKNLKSIYWIQISPFGIAIKTNPLIFEQECYCTTCSNFVINWWYYHLQVGGKHLGWNPRSFSINSYFIVKVWVHFTLWVARSRPHLNIIIFLPYTATYLSYNYWIWSLYMGSRRTSCFLFEFIYIYMCKQLLMLDVVSLTLIAQCPEECVCSIWN